MNRVYVVATGSTPFAKHPEQSHTQLAEAALEALMKDASRDRVDVDGIWFGNCALSVFGQDNIRGQVVLRDALESTIRARAPVVNIEGGCATGTATLQGAFMAVASGQADQALALGVEKTWVPHDPVKSFTLFLQGIDQLDPEHWQQFYTQAAEAVGETFAPIPQRVVFLDIHGLGARHDMAQRGIRPEHLAAIAAKNHNNGKLNERAQYRFGATVASVLDDKPIVAPFTRSMCSPISDGAAAAWLVSEQALSSFDPEVRERAVELRTVALQGGRWRGLGEPDVVEATANRAYAMAGITADQVDVAEVHDCNAWRELDAYSALGFCDREQVVDYVESGISERDGERPVNVSGGLIAKGHPLGATGIGMVDEVVRQLRGEAGLDTTPTIGITQNAGGLIGFDEALCGVTVLTR